MSRLILASGSPRRRELLDLVGLSYVVVPSNVAETIDDDVPASAARRLAIVKARAVAARNPHDVVLGADSVVAVDGRILGKPSGPEQALDMLGRLQGRSHQVLTGVAIARLGGVVIASHVEETVVTMRAATLDELRRYVGTGEPFDKAGGYAIQGQGGLLVSSILGCYSNVVGLPLCVVCQSLTELGFDCRRHSNGKCSKVDAYCPFA